MEGKKKTKKIKLDMTKTIKDLEAKTIRNPYWGTGLSGGVNVSDRH